MNNDCVNCKSKCCMAGLDYSAVMTKEEVDILENTLSTRPDLRGKLSSEHFYYRDEKIDAYKMRKFENCRCVFWNPETFGCDVYQSRPLDCRIFPLEYRWFRWLHSPQCPSGNFDKNRLLSQFKDFTPKQIRALKLLHIRTPESTKDKLWIFMLKVLPIEFFYAMYVKLRS